MTLIYRNSKKVHSTQSDIHEKLPKLLQRQSKKPFLKPISDQSRRTFAVINQLYKQYDQVMLDACCGVGLSSYLLAKQNKDQFVIGIDKSEDRIQRKNHFCLDRNVRNYQLFTADLIDIIRLMAESSYMFSKVYLLYPNPYPKPTQLNKRWHAHPVFLELLKITRSLEIRSNWEIYLQEMAYVLEKNDFSTDPIALLEIVEPLTLFEKKYHESGHDLYQLQSIRIS
jgi:tRNA (guanine-N7-)-methyltransferase